MDLLMPHLKQIKVPGSNDKVYKDECLFSFDNPVSNFGIYYVRLLKIIFPFSLLGNRNGSLREPDNVLRFRT